MLSLCWMSVNSWWNLSRVRPNAIRIPKTSCWIRNLAKTLVCKTRKTNWLKNTFKKDWESHCLIENTHYFCTRNDADVHLKYWQTNKNQAKIYFPKRFKKVCEIRKRMLPLHPANERRSLKRWREKEENSEKKFSKKNFTKSLPDKKKLFTFAPAKRKNSELKNKTRS